MGTQAAGPNCTKSPSVLTSNSDISGKGILIGFGVTALSTLVLCVALYLVDFKRLSNPVDQYCIEGFYGLFSKPEPSEKWRPSERWTKALEAAVLTFSDQQVITGIAILISGYSQLRVGLAVYYWQLVVDLAWFSSVTHLTTLTCLRYYFRERRGLKILRLICMAVMAGMLSCALATTGYLGDNDFTYDYPAWCLFHRTQLKMATGGHVVNGTYHLVGDEWGQYHYYNSAYVVLVLPFLLVSYGTRIIQLFPFESDGLTSTLDGLPSKPDGLRKKVHNWLSVLVQSWLLKHKNKALDQSSANYWALVYTLSMAFYCIFRAAVDLYSSMLWEITWLAVALTWGSIRIIGDRKYSLYSQNDDPGSVGGKDILDAVSQDDIWGFGQVVAVALLAAPLFVFFENIYESVMMERKNSQRLPISASRHPDPVPTAGSSSAEPWKNMYKCAWFHSLVWLIYLMSLTTAANILYVFPFEEDAYDLKSDIGSIIRYYADWFGVDLAILLLFTITLLSLSNVEDISQLRWTWRPEMLGMRTEQIQRILLIVLVLGLTASSAAFGWKTLFNSTFFFVNQS